ncbi:MAG: STAS domain-containing protein [Alphaproteobacteria bacterium]|nr:STAS domain-containing protein [Alphaproteobacteria bacterium]
MEISPDSGSGSTARIALTGRLDIQGAETVALPLATLSGAKQNVVIDMSGVSFIASIGIRHLVSASKALTRRGGRLVLLNLTAPVREVLEMAGIIDMVSTATSEEQVRALIGA